VFYEVEEDALTLLRAIKGLHDHHNPDKPLSEGTRLAPQLVAKDVGLDTETLRYERVMRYLVREGALVWDERLGSVPEVDLYRITTRGLKMLGAY
jgi:hypothetical protein